jgi:hypothetical protein
MNGTWPYGGGTIQYLNGEGGVFVPAVQVPAWDAPKATPSTLDPQKVYVYQQWQFTSVERTVFQKWLLPRSWQGLQLHAWTISPQGRQPGPELDVQDGVLTLSVTPGRPVVLTAH